MTSWPDLAPHIVDDLLALQPAEATELGDHRYDDRLEDLTPGGLDDQRQRLTSHLAALTRVNTTTLATAEAVDVDLLRTRVSQLLLTLDDTRDYEWDPSLWNPGPALHSLLVSDFAPRPDRLRSLAARLAQVPQHLETARRTLHDMPQLHVETAVGRFEGTGILLSDALEAELDHEPLLRSEVEPPRQAALEALQVHLAWLHRHSGEQGRDPRLGAELYARKLALTLDTEDGPDELLRRAENHLDLIEEQMAPVAARLGGTPAEVLAALALEGAVDNSTVITHCEQALQSSTDTLRQSQLVTLYGDPIDVVVMPEIHRGVYVAYCRAPGPLETAALPTRIEIAPAPSNWPSERVASFYREYNAHMLHNLMVHEGVPGHALQLGHARRFSGPAHSRYVRNSGTFVEGWAVLAEELMAGAGYLGAGNPDALRLQQLKIQMRSTLNAVLDIRVHTRGMSEAEAMALMTGRGMQEEGEAVGKWRRALLTSAQLPMYYAGYAELSDIARELESSRPAASPQSRHDALLGHGSTPPRHLRRLLSLS